MQKVFPIKRSKLLRLSAAEKDEICERLYLQSSFIFGFHALKRIGEMDALAAMDVHVSFAVRTYVLHLFVMQSDPDFGNDVELYGRPFELNR